MHLRMSYSFSDPQSLISLMQIRNCLDEYSTGNHIDIEFEGRRYRGVFKALMKLLDMLKKHSYHWNAFTARQAAWHEAGRSVLCFANLTICFDSQALF
jgi:hypothetical protein